MAKYTKTAWHAGRLITRNDMEKIEDQFEMITPGATNVAENYKSSETYSKGDYCLYDGELWKCIATPIGTDEERKPKENSIYWIKTKIMNETNSGISQSIANEYKENQNYEIGDYVTYNTDLYRCIEPTHGAWNSQKWELVILSNDITDLISVQNQQPDNDVNKIWIKKTGDSEVTLLTKDDIEENYCKTDTIAPTFSESDTYAVGEYVYYDGVLYRFTVAHAAGAWTGTDVVEAVIGQDVSELKSALDYVIDKNLIFVETATAGATNAYKILEDRLLVGDEYAFQVTSRTTGTYLLQAGIGQDASSMYDIGTYTFGAGEIKTIIGYSTDNPNIKYFRLYSADVPLANMDWDVSVYTYYDAKKEIDDVSERIDTGINEVNEEIMETWGTVLVKSIPVSDVAASNWYKSVTNALENTEYDFVITAQTAGTYLFQIGYGASASSMSLDVGTYTFTAGETKRITYTPIGSQLKFFRFYSASVPVANTIWTLAIQNLIAAEEIKNTQDSVSEINTLIGCEYLPTVKGEYYNTSGTTVDVTSPNSNAGWNSAVVPCAENDVFTITGTGGSSPRLWAFVASNGDIISHQDSAVTPSTVTDYVLYAPANSAYFVVNFSNLNPFRLLKGLTLENKYSIEDYENRITTNHKVVVDANGNGDFTTIQSAINSITDSSFTNQYEIILLEGIYNEQNLILPKYTYLHGVGHTKPTITSVGLSDYVSVIDAQNTCRIANVKVISGTKYCLHEDVKLNDCTVICESVEFEQMGTMNQTIIGNGVFENAKFIFNGCTFKGGQVFSHTNSNSFIGVTQHLVIKYCKFDNAGIVLSTSGSVESNTMADCICEVVGCRGDGTTPLITCRVPTDNVYPWKVIGGGNINFSVAYDGATLTDVVNTTDAN